MRLWPLSREHHPKQFLNLFGTLSMLQHTLLRTRDMPLECEVLPPLILCNEAHRFLVQEQCQTIEIDPDCILLEPCPRNTAPATILAALHEPEPDTLLLILPADQLVHDVTALHEGFSFAAELAEDGNMVCFGIPATSPETGYGYIQRGKQAGTRNTLSAYQVQAFMEKPDQATAERYLACGNYQWNSGMFMAKAGVWREQFSRLQDGMYAHCREALSKERKDGAFARLDTDCYTACPANSVDHALMEPLARSQESRLVTIPLHIGWSDLGSWHRLWEQGEKDGDGNHRLGDVWTKDVRGCELRADHRLLAAVGCRDMIMVETADTVLVADRSRSEEIKPLVDRMQKQGREEVLMHRRVHRPWGSYEVLNSGTGFKVKRICVKPGHQLSLQFHRHRSEHWVVVQGTARVTCADKTFDLHKNQSTWIAEGQPHRLANHGQEPLSVIEIQSGTYLGEDDIVRLEDDFGRA